MLKWTAVGVLGLSLFLRFFVQEVHLSDDPTTFTVIKYLPSFEGVRSRFSGDVDAEYAVILGLEENGDGGGLLHWNLHYWWLVSALALLVLGVIWCKRRRG